MKMRAYVIWEITIGGALVAIVCATLLTNLADARVRNTVAARDSIAAQLVQDKIEDARSRGFGNNPPDCTGAPVAVTSGGGSYLRTCTIVNGGNTNIGGLNLPFDTVTVTISYTPGTTGTRDATASTRRYQ